MKKVVLISNAKKPALIYMESTRLRQAEARGGILFVNPQPGGVAHCHQEWAGSAFCDSMWVRCMQIRDVGSALMSFA